MKRRMGTQASGSNRLSTMFVPRIGRRSIQTWSYFARERVEQANGARKRRRCIADDNRRSGRALHDLRNVAQDRFHEAHLLKVGTPLEIRWVGLPKGLLGQQTGDRLARRGNDLRSDLL